MRVCARFGAFMHFAAAVEEVEIVFDLEAGLIRKAGVFRIQFVFRAESHSVCGLGVEAVVTQAGFGEF